MALSKLFTRTESRQEQIRIILNIDITGLNTTEFGNFWRFSKFLTYIADYKIYSKFFHLFKNQNLGHL